MMLGLSFFRKRSSTISNPAFLGQLQKTIKGNQQFMESIESWRNLQIKYIGEMMEMQTKIRNRMQQTAMKADCQFVKLLDTVVKGHKYLITKLNQQIFDSSFNKLTQIIDKEKMIMEQEKNQNISMSNKKEELAKLKQKQQKIKKSLMEGMVEEICCRNSLNGSNEKEKIIQKVQEISKQQNEHDAIVQEAKQKYNPILQKSKANLKRFDQMQQNYVEEASQIVNKSLAFIQNFGEMLSNDIASKFSSMTDVSSGFQGSVICEQFQHQQQSILHSHANGYLSNTIEMIKSNQIDQIIDYSKDKQIRKKIKSVIQSNEVTPECTDEITRQVQLVKKVLKSKEMAAMEQFTNIISKNSKCRMNFVFMLQLYRINSQFQMTEDQIQPIVVLINQLLKMSHIKRDAFVLKQIIILLLTYYITIKVGQVEHKVYILDFFKKIKFFKDLQLWQSMLIQSIYSQKKATIRMLVTTSCISNKDQILQAEKTLILNQILYIVKNMILFDFNEKEVKDFAYKFVKLLKQDDRFLKDVYKSIQDAIKQEKSIKIPPQQVLEKHNFSKLTYISDSF